MNSVIVRLQTSLVPESVPVNPPPHSEATVADALGSWVTWILLVFGPILVVVAGLVLVAIMVLRNRKKSAISNFQ